MKIEEKWVALKDYEGFYEISNQGRIKSLAKTTCVGRRMPEKIRKLSRGTNGYPIVTLHKNRAQRMRLVHRLVAETFIPNPYDFYEVNHKNGIRHDNNVENLEWCNRSFNAKHAYETRLNSAQEEGHWNSKLTKYEVIGIRFLFFSGKHTVSYLRKIFNVTGEEINYILNNSKWKYITKEYVSEVWNSFVNKNKK